MKRRLFGALAALSVVLAGCGGGGSSNTPPPPPKLVPDSALPGLLLSADELNAVMGTSGMAQHAPVTVMGDHREMLPNLNCLGVWQVNEQQIYASSNWKSMRQLLSRAPDTDQWDDLAVQSVVSYRTADAAQQFFNDSAGRWAKCTNHTLNIQLNGQMLPGWRSGDLTKTDTRLTLPYTRGQADQTRSCQRVLSVESNLIFDIQACQPQQPSPVTVAGTIADKIESKVPK